MPSSLRTPRGHQRRATKRRPHGPKYNEYKTQTKEPLSLFNVDLEPQANNKEIFNLQFLGNTKITIEAPHKSHNIVQCQRCQAYGHSKTYCTKPYQCVKCGGQHDSKDCTKPRHNPAKCALCGDDHPANYKGCTVYRKNLVATRSNHPWVNNLSHQHPTTHPNQHCLNTQ